jgi:hypothetical protein
MKINEYYRAVYQLQMLKCLGMSIYDTAHDGRQQEIDQPTESRNYPRPVLNRTVQGSFCDIMGIAGLNTGLWSAEAVKGIDKTKLDHTYSRKVMSLWCIKECLGYYDIHEFLNWFYEKCPIMCTTIRITNTENSALQHLMKGTKYDRGEIMDLKHYKDIGISLIEIPTGVKTYSSLITDSMRELIGEVEPNHSFF